MRSAPSMSEVFTNERDGSERLTVNHTNWGEPYAEGAVFNLRSDSKEIAVSLERYEVKRLHEYLGRILTTMR